MKFPLLLTILIIPIVLIAAVYFLVTLNLLEKWIDGYFSIPQIEATELNRQLQNSDSLNILIFDVRTLEEFERSHLKFAVRLNPDMTGAEFKAAFGGHAARKQLIFYCSVGVRSSILAERVKKILPPAQNKEILNLRGGIFHWYNEGFPVQRHNGKTDDIHPYDIFWGKLLERRP